MLNDTTPSPILATITREELFKEFLAATFIEERSEFETDFSGKTVKEWFLNRLNYSYDLPDVSNPTNLLEELASDPDFDVTLDKWTGGCANMIASLRFILRKWTEVLHDYGVLVARLDFIKALEMSNDQIGNYASAITQAAHLIENDEQDCGKVPPFIKQPEHLAAVQEFLGEALPVLDRTYGQAAVLVKRALEHKAV